MADEQEAGGMVDMLTKAVGDIAAALTLAGAEDKIADWTAPYVEAINRADAAHPPAASPAGESEAVADHVDAETARLQEIADGAWGDGPFTRGAARRQLEALALASPAAASVANVEAVERAYKQGYADGQNDAHDHMQDPRPDKAWEHRRSTLTPSPEQMDGDKALREALIGPGDPEENGATLGRFGWLVRLSSPTGRR